MSSGVAAVPLVTVVIPARNEETDINRAIASVASQDYPLDRIEVVVVDGGSTDETARVAKEALDGTGFARAEVMSNPLGTTPSNLNAGLRWAQGTYLCRVDARSRIPPDYVHRCVATLSSRPEVVVVGGRQRAEADVSRGVPHAIARSLNNRVTMGGARYRWSQQAGAVDTVYLGAFRIDELRAVGGWCERHHTNQDFELNRRLGTQGLVWFDPQLDVRYVPRRQLSALAAQYRRFGRWKAAGWLEARGGMVPRHVLLLLAPSLTAVAGVALIRRRPWLGVAAGVTGAVLIERSSPGAAAPSDRVLTLAASGIVTGCWWLGVAEQASRWLLGERMLPAADGRHADADAWLSSGALEEATRGARGGAR